MHYHGLSSITKQYITQNCTVMKQIPGSKPKKFITKTILTNPSLYSLSITSLFDPQNKNLSKVYDALQNKRKIVINNEINQSRVIQNKILKQNSQTSKIQQSPLQHQNSNTNKKSALPQLDSLDQAYLKFQTNKIEPKIPPQTEKYESIQSENSRMSRGSSLPNLNIGLFHFRNSQDIKLKQSKHFNIINNLQ